jgi:TolB-like protein
VRSCGAAKINPECTLSEGELITDLAQIHSLRVISRTSVVQFKDTQKKLPDIAAELNVDAVIEGSVSRTGNHVRITAQLLDARRDTHLWAASYDREMSDVVALQGQVAKSIAEQVNASISPEEGAKLSTRRSVNPQAYDALLTAKFAGQPDRVFAQPLCATRQLCRLLRGARRKGPRVRIAGESVHRTSAGNDQHCSEQRTGQLADRSAICRPATADAATKLKIGFLRC